MKLKLTLTWIVRLKLVLFLIELKLT